MSTLSDSTLESIESTSSSVVYTDPTEEQPNFVSDLVFENSDSLCFGYLPDGVLSALVLRKPGDFCLTRDSANHRTLVTRYGTRHSAVAEFPIESFAGGRVGLKNCVSLEAASLGDLVLDLATSPIGYLGKLLSSVDIRLTRLVSPLSSWSLKGPFTLTPENVNDKKFMKAEEGYLFYSGVVYVGKSAQNIVIREAETETPETVDNLVKLFNKSQYLSSRNVPLVFKETRLIIGKNLGLVYNPPTGVTLPDFLNSVQKQLMTATQKLKLALSVVETQVRILEAGHLLPYTAMSDFWVQIDYQKWVPNVAVVSLDKLGKGRVLEYDILSGGMERLALEVPHTRQLTKETEVFHTAKIVSHIIRNNTKELCHDSAECVANAISRCLHVRPQDRPSMYGLYLSLRDALLTEQENI